MCQLTYVNLQDKLLNAEFVHLLTVIGSEKHDDGTGIMCSDNTIWKTKLAANKITNLGTVLSKIVVNKKPIPAHIRKATWGIAVNDENAHPFIGKHFLLMHNGTLVPKNDKKVEKEKELDSDSKRFLEYLDNELDKVPDGAFDDIFNKAMDNFSGKFAFIIRNKDTSTDYIIRGKTADLWVSYVQENGVKRGYVINTSKDLLLICSNIFSGMAKISHGIDLVILEPELLKNETIYKATKTGLDVVGFTKETEVIKAVVPAYTKYPAAASAKVSDVNVEKILKIVNKIYEFIKEHSLPIIDIQRLFLVSMGISLLEATVEDYDAFIDYVIPRISASNNTRKKIKKIMEGKIIPDEIYLEGNLEYPWMVNDASKVINALEKLAKKIN